jgi:nitrate/TMAO reductase-like tetraheme cytochrome c subunit
MSNDVRLIRCPTSVAGMVLTTISAVLFLVVFLADLFGWHTNPYVGIVFFLILPGVFIFGLVLIPLGAWLERRRRARGHTPSKLHWPTIDLNDPAQRTTAVIVFMLSMVNIIIVSLAAYRGVEYMDSPQFCGQACHTVMKPEYVAYQDGPHSRVACVECHIGSGATSFAKAKFSGARQLVALSFHTYARPIAGPVRNMRPARETCEQCHWPEKFHGDQIRKVYEYGNDEKNSESSTTLQVHVGGGSERLGLAQGIHWHMNIANEVEYITTDTRRQVIPWVRVKDRSGAVREYTAAGVTPEQIAKGERRRMDCMDCHNRPSHQIAATPERAVDEAIASGLLPRALPFVRREAVNAVKVTYPSQEAATAGISTGLRNFYQSQLPRADPSQRRAIETAVQGVGAIYRRNVFPEMNVTFGTYPTNIGHIDFPGCFRCHDDSHVAKDGTKITQDCDSCHKIE